MLTITPKSIPPSLTVAFHGMAYDLRQQGHTIFDLTAGEAKVPTHPLLVEALQEKSKAEPVYYAPVPGLFELREEASSWMNRSYDCSFQPEQCLVTAGGKFGLYLLFASLLQAGDEVLIPSPYWVTYPTLAAYWGGTPVVVATEETSGFRVTVEALERAVTEKSRVLVLNNAGNPTGTLYSREAIAAILDFAEAHNLVVIADEVYSELVYEGDFVSCASFPAHQDKVFVIQSCSKNLAMTGWRVGFVFGRVDVLKALTSLQGQSLTSASTVSQWVAITGLRNAETIGVWVREQMRVRRDHFVATFQEVFGWTFQPPSSALYAFLNLEAMGFSKEQAADSLQCCTDILQSSKVAMVPGIAFGMEGYVRCSFAGTMDDVSEGLRQVKAYLVS